MEKLKGFVEHIIYKNPENGYGVINLKVEQMEITCTGIFTGNIPQMAACFYRNYAIRG